MKKFSIITLIIILLIAFFLLSTMSVYAQEVEETIESAEINAYINNKPIPSIKTTDWTSINISVEDASGIPWGKLKSDFPILSVYIWPIIHPTWRPYLGYTKLQFDTEVIEGDGRGWYHKLTPNGIPEADQGRKYDLKLEVKTDDIAVDYFVVIRIKATRISAEGVLMGISYIDVPVKASSLNNIKMYTKITTKTTPPRSMIYYDIELANDGYYRDTFKVEVEGESGLIVQADKQALVLEPNEKKNVKISALTPEKFYDFGTPSRMKIYVSSISDSEKIEVGELIVIIEGFYISPIIITVLVFIIIFMLILWQSFRFIKEKKINRIEKEKTKKSKKKSKNILKGLFSNLYKPSEKQDRNIEYKSEPEPVKKEKTKKSKKKSKNILKGLFSNLYKPSEKQDRNIEYKSEPEPVKKEKTKKSKKKSKNILKGLFSNLYKPSEKQDRNIEYKSEPEPVKKEKPVFEINIDRGAEEDHRKKEIALAKIKKQQDKQRR